MEHSIGLPSGISLGLEKASMGLKLIAICMLAVTMMIPALLILGLVNERTRRAQDVKHEVSSHVGGPQTFLGPTLAVPYTVGPWTGGAPARRGMYLIYPAQANAMVQTSTTERHRSLFRVPVFQANLQFDATFQVPAAPAAAPQGAELDWSRAEIVVGASDARGALADGTLRAEGKTATLTPSAIGSDFRIGGGENAKENLTFLGASAAAAAKPGNSFQATVALRFSGAERIALLAYGRSTRVTAHGDWRSPSFDGGILPVSHTITKEGFQAEWSVPFAARGVRAEGPADTMTGLQSTALGISFVEVADPYQSVYRSLKYIPLFLGLVFLSYFVFEVTTGKRVHAAQYLLVGLAQMIFYLLLLSLAERLGFDWGFLIAGTATVALLSSNASWIFRSKMQGFRAFGVFGTLYGMIYLLLGLEDNALLVGAIASFAAVAAAMYCTRSMDWYRASGRQGNQQKAADASPQVS